MPQRRGVLLPGILEFTFLGLMIGCHVRDAPPQAPVIKTTASSSSIRVPLNVERLAVLYSRTSDRNVMTAYSRLESAVFHLKEQRPSLKIVDRSDFQTIVTEQQIQLSGNVSDETAIRVGRLLGADSVLLFRVDSLSLRDRALAGFHGQLPPVLVASKIIQVESSEVLFHNVVTSSVEKPATEDSLLSVGPFVQTAMDRAIEQTITDLQQAFR